MYAIPKVFAHGNKPTILKHFQNKEVKKSTSGFPQLFPGTLIVCLVQKSIGLLGLNSLFNLLKTLLVILSSFYTLGVTSEANFRSPPPNIKREP